MNRVPPWSAELSQLEEQEVRVWLSAAFFALTSSAPPTRGGGAFRYEVAVEDGAQNHRVVLAEGDVPAWLRPLILWLERKAGLRAG